MGGYTVVKKLAAGGFGVVYLAQGDNQQLVAIKEYLPASLAERSAVKRWPRRDTMNLLKIGVRHSAESFSMSSRALPRGSL